jgi:hypothetical protein
VLKLEQRTPLRLVGYATVPLDTLPADVRRDTHTPTLSVALLSDGRGPTMDEPHTLEMQAAARANLDDARGTTCIKRCAFTLTDEVRRRPVARRDGHATEREVSARGEPHRAAACSGARGTFARV